MLIADGGCNSRAVRWLAALSVVGCGLEHPTTLGAGDVHEAPTEAAVMDAPQPDRPSVDAPAADVPAIDTPTLDVRVNDVPVVDVPVIDVPVIDVPVIDVPAVDVPVNDVPAVDVPAVDVPAVDVPAVDVPGIDVPVVDGGSMCPSGQMFCAGGCRDTATSTSHCGACDHACGEGQMCVRGNCSTCGLPGQTCCTGGGCGAGATCVTVTNRCAACGGAGQRCCGGIAGSCGSGLTCLPVDVVVSYCVDLAGGGGNPGRACQSGNRCDSGYTCRTIPLTSVQYCIQCGRVDQPCCGSECSSGSCVGTFCL